MAETSSWTAAHLGTNCGVKEAAEIWSQVASCGVPEQIVLGLAAAAGVDVRLDARAPPVHQHVGHIPEQLRLDAAAAEALPPDVTLQIAKPQAVLADTQHAQRCQPWRPMAAALCLTCTQISTQNRELIQA